MLQIVSQNGDHVRGHVSTCVYLLLTFMPLSPDSPQLSLGETDEENSTKPHVQLSLLPPSPALYYSSPSLLLPCFPCHFAGRTGSLTSSLPHLSSLSLCFCSPTTAFSSPQPGFTAFLPPLSVCLSLLCFTSLFGPQSNFCDDGFVAGKQLTNRCVAE